MKESLSLQVLENWKKTRKVRKNELLIFVKTKLLKKDPFIDNK